MNRFIDKIKNELEANFAADYPSVVSGFFVYGEHPDKLPLIVSSDGVSVFKVLQDSVIPYVLIRQDAVLRYSSTQLSSCRVKDNAVYSVSVFFVGSDKYDAEALEAVLRYYINNMGYSVSDGSFNKFKVYEWLSAPFNKPVDNVNNILRNYSLVGLRFTVVDTVGAVNKCAMPLICKEC